MPVSRSREAELRDDLNVEGKQQTEEGGLNNSGLKQAKISYVQRSIWTLRVITSFSRDSARFKEENGYRSRLLKILQ
jgi:hypothetical protein